MFSSAGKFTENIQEQFLLELHSRTSPLPFKSSNGNKCFSIDMADCTPDFIFYTEKYLEENPTHFKLHVTGEVFYVEIISKKGLRQSMFLQG